MRCNVSTNTPDGFGRASATDFGGAAAVMFTSDGMFTDQTGNPINGSVFLGQPSRPMTSRALTVFGPTARIRVYRWNGTQWSMLGAGLNATGFALMAFNDGIDNALYIGGSFTQANGLTANRVVRYVGCPVAGNPADIGTIAADRIVQNLPVPWRRRNTGLSQVHRNFQLSQSIGAMA